MQTYASYKDSGLVWLGEIPLHWEITKLKHETQFLNGAAFKPNTWSSHGTPIIRIENLNGSKDFNYFNGEIDSRYEVYEGDLLFAWSGNIGTSFGPYIWSGAGRYYLNQHIFKLINYTFDKKYFYWLLKAVTTYVESRTHGIIGLVHITKQELGDIKVPKIPLEEQQAIAGFLDLKSQQIDLFINNKQALIALLKEQQAALINHVITKGLNPDIKFKPSGINWLDDIPAHWENKRAKYYFTEIDERSEAGDEELLSVSHITGITPRSEKNITMFMAESYEGYKTCRRGDLVINIMWAWMGALGVSDHKGIVSSAYGVYRQKDKSNFYGPYLDYLSRSRGYIAEFTCRSKGVTSSRARMYTDDFFDIPIIRPPYEEQVEIVQYIKRESAIIEKAIAKAKQEIELIKELHTTLISDVVAGKINVLRTGAIETVATPTTVIAFPSPPTKPTSHREAPPAFKRAVLGAEIVHQLHSELTFGKVKLQKLLYLCEHHVQLKDFESNYLRDAAGPHDNRMMRSVMSQMESHKWYRFDEAGKYGEKFIALAKAGGHREYFNRYWGEKLDSIQYVIDLLRKEKTDRCQMVATLYAAWNDLLLTGKAISDDEIISEVLNAWHESKRQIPEETWRNTLTWMRSRNFVPSGFGKPTHYKKEKSSRDRL